MEQKFLDEFNLVFGTELKESKKNYTMLIQLFHNYIEQSFKTSELYNSIISKILEIEDELKDNLTEQGKELFEKWETYRDELSTYEWEQSFMYGYCLNKELEQEKNNYKNGSDE